jgi:predicted ATPase/transcriptional regulator with XRE-family HTH domain
MDYTTAFGPWLKERRVALDLSGEELAACINYSAATLRNLESGRRRPSRQLAERLAHCLKIPPEEYDSFIAFARGVRDLPVLPHLIEPETGKDLPVPLTPMLGRDAVVAAVIQDLLTGGFRLLTLTGAPGVGKTRVGLAVASEVSGAFTDGVCYVELVAVSDPELLAQALAQALGLTLSSGTPVTPQLIAHLRGKHLLLVLDNFEHLLPAAPLLTRLLAAAPRLRILVTSRAALRVVGEYVIEVPTLPLPDLACQPSLEQLAQNPAVALFVARIQATQRHFVLTRANALAVARLCIRLDGLPLALEIMAAWSRLLAPAELLERISEHFDLHWGIYRDVSAHHQTLHAALDRSYALLPPPVQQLLARLSVFVAEWNIEAAEQVCSDAGLCKTAVLAGLATLIDHSLVQIVDDSDTERRFTMLRTIREYARERLRAMEAESVLRMRHAAYYRALAQQAKAASHSLRSPVEIGLTTASAVQETEVGSHNPRQVVWTAWFDREQPNHQTALSGVLEQQNELPVYVSQATRDALPIKDAVTVI